MDPHGLARSSSLTRCSLRRGHDRYLIMIPQWSLLRAIQLSPPFSALRCHHASPFGRYILDLWAWFSYGFRWPGLHVWWEMVSCHLFIWPVTHPMPYWAYFRFRWDLRIFTEVTCLMRDGFMSLVVLTCYAPDAIRGHIFHFRWDLRIFTKVTCSTIDDFMSLVLLTCRAPDAILGHIFHFIWDLWIFMDVACSMINDFMLPTLRPIIRSMSTRAYYHSGWNLYILVELRAYPHLRDVPRDDDLFTIFTMIPQ